MSSRPDIATLRKRRTRTAIAADAAHRDLLNAVIERVESDPDTNVRELARYAGLNHNTIYNELARRQDRADQLSSNGAPPAAPHDDDRDA